MNAARQGRRRTSAVKHGEGCPEDARAGSSELRLGGMALSNGLIVVSSRHWAAAIREEDGSVGVASGKKPLLPGTGERSGARADCEGIPLVRGLGRLAESVAVLGLVKKRLPGAKLPFESARVAAALAASMAGATAVRVIAPRSALTQEAGTALAAFVPTVLSLKNSPVAGYHGAEHKVIGAREEASRGSGSGAIAAENSLGDAEAAAKEHDRCGSNLVGPYLVTSVLANLLARDRRGRKTPVRSLVAGAASLGVALEAMRWSGKHADSFLAKTMMFPGRLIQKSFTTTEPTSEQLEVGQRALAELLELEGVER